MQLFHCPTIHEGFLIYNETCRHIIGSGHLFFTRGLITDIPVNYKPFLMHDPMANVWTQFACVKIRLPCEIVFVYPYSMTIYFRG